SDYGKEQGFKGKFSFKEIPTYVFIIAVLALGLTIKLLEIIVNLREREKKQKKFRRKFRGDYYRNYPYDGHFIKTYYLLYKMGASNFKNLLSAFLLKWENDNIIKIKIEQVGI